MSLINDMLRDLEKRQKSERGTSVGESSPVVVERRPRRLLIFSGLIVLLAVAVWFGTGVVSKTQDVKSPVASKPASPRHETAANTEKPVKIVSEAVVEESSAENTAVPTVVEEPPSPEVVPSGEIAVELSGLSVEKANNGTLLGLTFSQLPQYRVVERGGGTDALVISFNQTRLQSNFEIPPTAGTLIRRLSFVPQKGQLDLLIDLPAKSRMESSQLIEIDPHNYRLAFNFIAVKEEPREIVAVASAPPRPPVVEEKKEEPTVARASKKVQAIARDQQAYLAGMKQLSAGQLAAAEASFTQALLVRSEFVDARLQLVSLLQQQKEFGKAEKYLQQGLALAPESSALRKAYARQLLQEQRQRGAIDVLQKPQMPAMAQDLEYYALLAAALQAVGDYRSASSVYARLVKLRPKNALWWMGVAVSLEQTGYRGEARSAYQKALSLPGLRPDLQSYIQGRLLAL